MRDMFFPGKGKANDRAVVHVHRPGAGPRRPHHGRGRGAPRRRREVWRLDLAHSDRARAESATDGAIVVVTAKDKVVGAHILAPSAGEMIHELALAMREDLKLSALAGLIHVYPTLSTGIGQLAAEAAFEKAGKPALAGPQGPWLNSARTSPRSARFGSARRSGGGHSLRGHALAGTSPSRIWPRRTTTWSMMP